MEKLVKGDIIVIDFYFADINASKRRPAMVLVAGEDILLAEITSKSRGIDDILIKKQDFQHGSLREESWLRPLRLAAFHKSKVAYKLGHLKNQKINEVIGVICGFLRK